MKVTKKDVAVFGVGIFTGAAGFAVVDKLVVPSVKKHNESKKAKTSATVDVNLQNPAEETEKKNK